MKTVLVRYYSPEDIGIPHPEQTKANIKKFCFKVNKFKTEGIALEAYANLSCAWSTLLDETDNVNDFIKIALNHILERDLVWLEQNFS